MGASSAESVGIIQRWHVHTVEPGNLQGQAHERHIGSRECSSAEPCSSSIYPFLSLSSTHAQSSILRTLLALIPLLYWEFEQISTLSTLVIPLLLPLEEPTDWNYHVT